MMKLERLFTVVDSHTEGEPTRVVIGGGTKIPGKTMAEKRDYFRENLDHIRRMLVQEPRGHADMFVAFLVPPTTDEADVGVLFMNPIGYRDMCGHATIGVTTVVIETGMVTVKEPTTEVKLDTPAGLVRARANIIDGLVDSVTFTNVSSFFVGEYSIEAPELGNIKVDVAFGGNFFIFVSEEEMGVRVDKENVDELITKGRAVVNAAEKQIKVHHPNPSIAPSVRAVMIYGPPTNPKASGKNIVITRFSFDRSPCGTGTCARMATLYAKRKLKLNEEFIHESILGSLFKGRLIQETKVGEYTAVIPEVTGSAYISGFNTIVSCVNDPFKNGFSIK
ncbi:MAG TPA: proline racemase family protein [Dehalococcoidales bacterium]|nr:proline racemase family protein [Dehalococcoidales bacterium]